MQKEANIKELFTVKENRQSIKNTITVSLQYFFNFAVFVLEFYCGINKESKV